jgi:TatD DNase family protein
MPIIETHCHLDYLEKEPLADILQKSKDAGIERIITISVDPENLDKAFAISNAHKEVYFTQGIHPHDAKEARPDDMKKIIERCIEPKMVAVGEIGLDYHYNHSPRDIQLNVFEEQLEIAINNNKPVVIHSREADDDMISILKNFGHKMPKNGVIHSFTSTKKLAETALDQGFYLGFNGIITFKKAQEVRDIVEYAPIERLLIETDAPFLTPAPHRGKENAPYYLQHILEKLSEIKGLDVMKAEQILYKNSFDLFFRDEVLGS